ncbi:RBBP9/YdeN family alpha/beta hydrolase [Sedimenticola hydrogenitrophicus]|uniref:RBBP9/YdeN family alpha/beta hydrolase n=1 Tax=Sedimenticola hydrogenitrophicus TaxID=2967975 RepID=UPI0023AF2317|nr:alpha/beta fold hydrolase [Sedimenticola hydrogenitrophicus]
MHTSNPIHHIIVPGYGNSGAAHWQSHWQQRLPNSRRTRPTSWDFPEHDDWVAALDREITAAAGPVILIAHSLGTITVAEWAAEHASDRVIGALLVAIPDVQRPDLPDAIQGFSNPQLAPLPFPAIAVLSRNDPYSALQRGRLFAERLGARVELLGDYGHINHESGLGEWEAGLKWLDELITTAGHTHSRSMQH